MEDNSKKYRIYLPIIFSLVLILGMFLGTRLTQSGGEPNRMFSIAPVAYDKIRDILNYIENDYVDTVNTEELREAAITEIITQLDPHSQYIAAQRFTEVKEEMQGNFEGIGVQFRMEKDTVAIIQVIPGGPSEKVGLLSGDRIVTIEKDTVAGVKMDTDDIVKQLKGKRGTKVNIGIFRRGEQDLIDFTIIRDIIPTYSVDASYMVTDSVGYVKLSKFSATSYTEVRDALLELKEKGMSKLIFDLRGNSGGYLGIAIHLADEFLSQDKLIVYTKGTNRPKEMNFASKAGIFENQKLIVLIDENSASASEIIAGAVQDNDRGAIIGRRSFGKGLVQEELHFQDGSALRLTVARYYTPSGRCIQKSYENGIEEYYKEFYERFHNGELESEDSIKLPDSLKYYTLNGREVYGGGGITPDIFVPLDYDAEAVYYNKILNRGVLYQFAFEYTDSHREELKKYEVTKKVFNEFVAFASVKGVEGDSKQIKRDQAKLEVLIKAFIGRNLYDDKAFYPIYHKIDKGIEKALEVLDLGKDEFKKITQVKPEKHQM
ncbi:MAG: S41 family peptidase [Bacteroidales bacterium]|nr:S41 family peptidase [Bacteroidales bacterium]